MRPAATPAPQQAPREGLLLAQVFKLSGQQLPLVAQVWRGQIANPSPDRANA